MKDPRILRLGPIVVKLTWRKLLSSWWFDVRDRVACWIAGADYSAPPCRHCDFGRAPK